MWLSVFWLYCAAGEGFTGYFIGGGQFRSKFERQVPIGFRLPLL
jgi:hypothetical protein